MSSFFKAGLGLFFYDKSEAYFFFAARPGSFAPKGPFIL
jgi:hypothetical protein